MHYMHKIFFLLNDFKNIIRFVDIVYFTVFNPSQYRNFMPFFSSSFLNEIDHWVCLSLPKITPPPAPPLVPSSINSKPWT